MAKRRKHTRRASTRRNPPASRRRRHSRRHARRNPPRFSAKGAVGSLVQGVKDAVFIEAGKIAVNTAARMVPVTSTIPALGVRAALALVAGIGAKMIVGADAARFVLAGALTSPIETAIRATNVPLLANGLSGDDQLRNYVRGIGSYPQVRRVGVGSYPQVGVGDAGSSVAMMSGQGGMNSGASYF